MQIREIFSYFAPIPRRIHYQSDIAIWDPFEIDRGSLSQDCKKNLHYALYLYKILGGSSFIERLACSGSRATCALFVRHCFVVELCGHLVSKVTGQLAAQCPSYICPFSKACRIRRQSLAHTISLEHDPGNAWLSTIHLLYMRDRRCASFCGAACRQGSCLLT